MTEPAALLLLGVGVLFLLVSFLVRTRKEPVAKLRGRLLYVLPEPYWFVAMVLLGLTAAALGLYVAVGG